MRLENGADYEPFHVKRSMVTKTIALLAASLKLSFDLGYILSSPQQQQRSGRCALSWKRRTTSSRKQNAAPKSPSLGLSTAAVRTALPWAAFCARRRVCSTSCKRRETTCRR